MIACVSRLYWLHQSFLQWYNTIRGERTIYILLSQNDWITVSDVVVHNKAKRRLGWAQHLHLVWKYRVSFTKLSQAMTYRVFLSLWSQVIKWFKLKCFLIIIWSCLQFHSFVCKTTTICWFSHLMHIRTMSASLFLPLLSLTVENFLLTTILNSKAWGRLDTNSGLLPAIIPIINASTSSTCVKPELEHRDVNPWQK